VNPAVIIESDGEVVALGGETTGPLVDSVVGKDGAALREEKGGRKGGREYWNMWRMERKEEEREDGIA
jgi:hypothetical protein